MPFLKLLEDGYPVLPIFFFSRLSRASSFIFCLQIMLLKLLCFLFPCPGIYLIYPHFAYPSVTKTGVVTLAKASWLVSEIQDHFMCLAGNVLTYTTWNDECLLYKNIILVTHAQLMIHFESQILFIIPEAWTNFPSSSWFAVFFLSGYLCIYPHWMLFVHFRLSLQGFRWLLMILMLSLWVLVTSPSLVLLESCVSSYSIHCPSCQEQMLSRPRLSRALQDSIQRPFLILQGTTNNSPWSKFRS